MKMLTKAAAATAVVGMSLAAGLTMTTPGSSSEVVAQPAGPTTFKVDPVHSMVFFSIAHLNIAKNYGRFNNPEGTFNLNEDDLSKSFINIRVNTKDVDTGHDGRDDHLRSPDFFNAREFPAITFKSGSFTEAGEQADRRLFRVTGDLAMLGVTKPIEVMVYKTGEGDTGRQGYKQGIEATFTIKRSDFGMTKYLEGNVLGDEIELRVTMEGARQ